MALHFVEFTGSVDNGTVRGSTRVTVKQIVDDEKREFTLSHAFSCEGMGHLNRCIRNVDYYQMLDNIFDNRTHPESLEYREVVDLGTGYRLYFHLVKVAEKRGDLWYPTQAEFEIRN